MLRGSCCCGRAVELLLLRDEERKLKGIYGSMERVGWDGIISSVGSCPGARISWGLIFAERWWAFCAFDWLAGFWWEICDLDLVLGVDGFGRLVRVCVHRIVPPAGGDGSLDEARLNLAGSSVALDFATCLFG